EWAVAGVTPNLPAGARLRLVSFPGQRRIGVHVLNAAGEKLQVFDLPGLMEVVPQTPTTRLQVWYKRTPPKDAKQTQFFDVYRGSVRVYINAAGLLDTVNVLGLEDYVRSVVPSEMPSHWPAEALRAQTLAVRTYGVTSLRPEHPVWDVDDTTNFQVYLGANHETGPTDAAVAATKNLAITYQGQPIRAYFFSTANGHTDANEDVFGGPPLPYLRPVADVDPSGKPWDWESPRAVWETKEFRLTELTPLFNTIPGHGLGEIRMLDFSKRTMSGRLRSVVATGSNGQATLSSWEFVRRFNALTNRDIGTMLSTRFTLTFRYPLTQPVPPLNLPGGQSLYFPQTGHNVRHAFLAYFTRRGGVAAFGLPLTEEFTQNGRTVQYFERARLEYHPEQAGTPFEVQLGLLGDLVTEDRRPFPGVASFPSGPEHRYFPETGHSAHFAFLAYFEANGGIARFGHPVSEEFTENGVTVQFFQRARLEYRPLQHPAQPVQEAHLGREYLRQIGLMG
ncbi:MAG: SpoIID/LytB domain-containing protein, partial [Actinobacteria bacterium]|nr:SpoIID/LytB domain-containing protein [Actinomycetota bacterium]